MGTPDAIRVNRVKLGLTQAQLARDINVDTRQINRYETGETEPTLAIARRLADRLRISMDELAGGASPLNGTWWSAWHNILSGGDVALGAVELAQQGRHLTIQPLRSSKTEDLHPLIWSAELYVDADTLLGGFKIENEPHKRRGLLNLVHRDDGITGTWIRIALGNSSTGSLALARSVLDADTALRETLNSD